jgi:hypothetical protein
MRQMFLWKTKTNRRSEENIRNKAVAKKLCLSDPGKTSSNGSDRTRELEILAADAILEDTDDTGGGTRQAQLYYALRCLSL